MLPEPALSLTIPSLHDGTPLNCRVYHPASLAAANPRAPRWRRHAAVFAHPYAPLGGSYDDGVVDVVAGTLLRKGFLVGTFNFRGAGHSAGRTSWTAKPERDDYASFVGFLVHYAHHLDPFKGTSAAAAAAAAAAASGDGNEKRISTVDEEGESDAGTGGNAHAAPVLLMGGYSYGAMITARLSSLRDIVELFASPAVESHAAHIRLRAEHVAGQQNEILGGTRAAALARRQRRQLSPTSPSSPASARRGPVRIGGDEGPASPRRSCESGGRRSFSLDDAEDRLRRGVHELLEMRKRHGTRGDARSVSGPGAGPARPGSEPAGRASSAGPAAKEDNKATLPAVGGDLTVPRPAYLLVSPLQGLVTHLATMNLVPSALKSRVYGHHRKRDGDGEVLAAAERKLVTHPTLAVYGDRDVFVPVGRLRAWAARLTAGAGAGLVDDRIDGAAAGSDGGEGWKNAMGGFRAHEVAAAGHFWAEEGMLEEMRRVVGDFAARLLC